MSDEPSGRTRRSLLRLGAGILGASTIGTAVGHPGADQGKERGDGIDGPGGEPFGLDDGNPFENTSAVGYHSMARVGRASPAGRPEQRHDGDTNAEVDPGETRTFTHFVETDSGAGSRALGPVEVSGDGEEWAAVAGTTETNGNVGTSPGL